MIKFFLFLVAIISPSCSVIIRCRFIDDTWVYVGARYTCEVVGVQMIEIPEVTEIVGDHADRSHFHVEGFSTFGKLFFSTFPRNIGQFFPNLVAIGLWGNQLSSISSADLEFLPDLKLLSVRKNKIEGLHKNLFQSVPKLEWISFADNLIQSIEDNLLSDLSNLTFVDFQNNSCINNLATTPEATEDLKTRLSMQCPSNNSNEETNLAATDSPSTLEERDKAEETIEDPTTEEPTLCSVRCSINEEVNNLKALAANLKTITEQQSQRIGKLENIVRQFYLRLELSAKIYES